MIKISEEDWLEASNIFQGVYSPITGFLDRDEYFSVVNEMKLLTGEAWPIPISLAIEKQMYDKIQIGKEYSLHSGDPDHLIGSILISDKFELDYSDSILKVYGTESREHPGVVKEVSRSPFRLGGKVILSKLHPPLSREFYKEPKYTRDLFKKNEWNSITGFQTRNPPHRAHEYLQRIAMNITDAVFIQPLIGWKKIGDFTIDAVIEGYRSLIKNYYPESNIILSTLEIPMRYAGPREAVLHALIRKNFGCTHFIVGRDHAGVGNFYDKYAAQELCLSIKDLGIQILPLSGPFYCKICESISTESECRHSGDEIIEISGTLIRKKLMNLENPGRVYLRPEVANKLIELSNKNQLFINRI